MEVYSTALYRNQLSENGPLWVFAEFKMEIKLSPTETGIRIMNIAFVYKYMKMRQKRFGNIRKCGVELTLSLVFANGAKLSFLTI